MGEKENELRIYANWITLYTNGCIFCRGKSFKDLATGFPFRFCECINCKTLYHVFNRDVMSSDDELLIKPKGEN